MSGTEIANIYNASTAGKCLAPEIGVEAPVGTGLTDNVSTVNFGSQTVGTPSPPTTFKIINNGTTMLNIGAIPRDGTNSADFTINTSLMSPTVEPGGTVVYSITASNVGSSNAPSSTMADTFQAAITSTSWTCPGVGRGTCTASGSNNISDTVNLPAGGSVTYTVTANISAGATGILSNTATVTAPGGVTDPTSGIRSSI